MDKACGASVPNKINYLLGGVQTDGEIAAIIALAYQQRRSCSGWTLSHDGRSRLRRETIAGIFTPKTVLYIRDGGAK